MQHTRSSRCIRATSRRSLCHRGSLTGRSHRRQSHSIPQCPPRLVGGSHCAPSRPPARPTSSVPAAAPSTPAAAAGGSSGAQPSSLTERIFAQIDALGFDAGAQAQGAGGRTTYAAFQAVDEQWARLREGSAAGGSAPQFVRNSASSLLQAPQYDVVVCGGTLGIFAAAALAHRGLKVAVLERGPLRGRAQEWNISRKELYELEHVGVATRAELDECVAIEFNPVRVGFAWQADGAGTDAGSSSSSGSSRSASGSGSSASGSGLTEVWTRDVLNLGVRPDALVQLMRRKLEEAGGAVLECTALEGIAVQGNGVTLNIRRDAAGPSPAPSPTPATTPLTARLVVDCMGHSSPIMRQVRWGQKPDGVCLVVGTLGSGFTDNSTADVILTNTPMQPDDASFSRAQYFWEAFPAASGPTDRTTYMFTYLTADPYRPPLAAMLDDYWRLMPQYQGVRLEDITFKRVLFGFFPTFKDTPLKPAFDRVIQIGDASGLQSPLSFGGFGALTRHLARLTDALVEAVQSEALDRDSLGLIHSYNPGLSSSWMMQKAMSVRLGEQPPPQLINRMLAGNFRAMQRLGEPVMKPFLQDVIQFGAMVSTLVAQMATDPASIPGLIRHVGPLPLAEWLGHMTALGVYTALHRAASAVGARRAVEGAGAITPRERFALNRLLDAWEYGSGLDYKL